MPKPPVSEVASQKHVRYYYQPDGAGPGNPIHYGGLDGQYLVIEDQTNPKRGSRERINVHDLSTPGLYQRVGDSISAPDFPSATVQFMQKHGAVPGHLIGYDCPMNFYQVVGNCKDLSDMHNGVTDYWKIFSHGVHETSTEKGGAFDADDALQDGLDFTFDNIYPVGALSFGEEGASEITLEIIDGVYGSNVRCESCGPRNDGSRVWYGVQTSDTGTPMKVVMTNDSFGTMQSVAITGAIDTDFPTAIDVVGAYLVVTYNGVLDAGYFVAPINDLTGIPGTFTKVTTGFATTTGPNDIWVENPREVYFACKDGYIRKSENILQGVFDIHSADVTSEDLIRIVAHGSVVLAVGDNDAIVVSYNRGATFSAPTNAPASSGNGMISVAIRNEYEFWAGYDSGEIYYTKDRGESAWTELVSGVGTISQCDDIVWTNNEVGYISVSTSDPTAHMIATFDGGETWSLSTLTSGRFVNWSVFDRGNRLSYPKVSNYGIASNYVVVAGLAGNGTDGIVLYGKANITP